MKPTNTAPPGSSLELRRLGPLSSLSEEHLDRLFLAMKPREFRAGACLNLAKDFVGRVGLIWSGLFVTTVSLPPRRTVVLSRLKPGSAFAHMPSAYGAFFGDGHRLRCGQAGVVLQLEAAMFSELVRSAPPLMQAMLAQSTLSAAEYAARVYELSALTARERIQAELLRLARDGEWIGRTSRISPRPTHQEIADQVGVAREVATRCLHALADEGVIRLGAEALEVIDVDGLLELDRAATGRRLFNPEDYVKTQDRDAAL